MLYGDGTGKSGKNSGRPEERDQHRRQLRDLRRHIARSSAAAMPGNAINGQVNATGGVVMGKALLQNTFGACTFNRAYTNLPDHSQQAQ